jgi:hypothetical protein
LSLFWLSLFWAGLAAGGAAAGAAELTGVGGASWGAGGGSLDGSFGATPSMMAANGTAGLPLEGVGRGWDARALVTAEAIWDAALCT